MHLVSSGCCWVEIKPLVTSEIGAASFVPVLDVLYDFALPFRFVVMDTREGGVGGRCLVRFFIQFANKQVQMQISNVIKAFLDVEISETHPPTDNVHSIVADLELAKNYALPITDCLSEDSVNLIDRLVACIAGSGAWVEVVAKADPNAAMGVQKFVYAKTTNTPNISKIVLDQTIDLIGESVDQTPKKNLKQSTTKRLTDPWLKECTKNAQTKLANKLFTCKITIKTNSLQQALTIKNALPATNMNRLKIHKHKPNNTTTTNPTKLKSPSRYLWQNDVLCRLWWILPLSILLLAGLLGLFHPTNILTGLNADVLLLGCVAFLSIGLFTVFKKRQPIVLSTQELSQITGLPTAVTKLPIAVGKAPIARMQLAQNPNHNNPPNQQNNNQQQQTNKKQATPTPQLSEKPQPTKPTTNQKNKTKPNNNNNTGELQP